MDISSGLITTWKRNTSKIVSWFPKRETVRTTGDALKYPEEFEKSKRNMLAYAIAGFLVSLSVLFGNSPTDGVKLFFTSVELPHAVVIILILIALLYTYQAYAYNVRKIRALGSEAGHSDAAKNLDARLVEFELVFKELHEKTVSAAKSFEPLKIDNVDDMMITYANRNVLNQLEKQKDFGDPDFHMVIDNISSKFQQKIQAFEMEIMEDNSSYVVVKHNDYEKIGNYITEVATEVRNASLNFAIGAITQIKHNVNNAIENNDKNLDALIQKKSALEKTSQKINEIRNNFSILSESIIKDDKVKFERHDVFYPTLMFWSSIITSIAALIALFISTNYSIIT